ncbi:MAG: hypothetical protein KY447_09950 [Actinobacteria bacterium]|nr:hypothetical protein [Actinomycetota bacterium]
MSPPFLFAALDEEWRRLGSSAPAKRALHAWAAGEPALRQFATPAELVEAIQHRGRPLTSDRLLGAVVRSGRSDPSASRCALQALVPGLRAIGCAYVGLDDPEELDARLVAAAWEEIRCTGLDGPWVARRVLRAVARRLANERRAEVRSRTLEATAEPPVSRARSVAEEALVLLVGAVERGVVSAEDATLITATRLTGEPVVAVARQGESVGALQQRRFRAEARLAGEAS